MLKSSEAAREGSRWDGPGGALESAAFFQRSQLSGFFKVCFVLICAFCAFLIVVLIVCFFFFFSGWGLGCSRWFSRVSGVLSWPY